MIGDEERCRYSCPILKVFSNLTQRHVLWKVSTLFVPSAKLSVYIRDSFVQVNSITCCIGPSLSCNSSAARRSSAPGAILRASNDTPCSSHLKLPGFLRERNSTTLGWLECSETDLPLMLSNARLRSKDNQHQPPAIALHQTRRIFPSWIRISVIDSEKDMVVVGRIVCTGWHVLDC